MRIERVFTATTNDPFQAFPTRSISIEICHRDATKRLCIPDFEIPAHWSDAAGEHLARHYARRAGVPSSTRRIAEKGVPDWLQRSEATDDATLTGEHSALQMVRRLVGTWTYWGWTQGYFDTEDDARAFHDEHAFLILSQRAMPASPQWSQTGLHWAYGIEGEAPKGNYYVDAQSGELCQPSGAYERPQHHHYFIQGVTDDLSGEGGIADLLQREMRVFKSGSNSGCNLSHIRGSSEMLSSGQRPAGLAAFMAIGDEAASALRSDAMPNDTASKLSLIDCDHPDVMRLLKSRLAAHREHIATAIGQPKQRLFFQWIAQAVKQSNAPGDARYNPKENEALASVMQTLRDRQVSESFIQQSIDELRACAGEEVRLSDDAWPTAKATPAYQATQLGLRLSDHFMRAAATSQDWALSRRTDGEPSARLPADVMLNDMAHFGWLTGDAMIAFDDHINRWHGCKTAGPIRASSPGGAFAFIDNSACDVAVINLASWLNEADELDLASFEHTARLQTIMCDIAITMAQFPSAEIAYNSYRFRPIGLSACNLAPLLMAMGYAYDSDEGRNLGAALCALMTGTGYVTSAEIARELGGFEAFSDVRDGMMHLMWQHHEAAFGRTQHLGTADSCPPVIDHSALPDSALADAVQRVWDQAMIKGDEFGYSNAQISLIASSPNVMRLMDAQSPGIAALSSFDRHNPHAQNSMLQGLAQLGYSEEQTSAIAAYVFGRRGGLEETGITPEMLEEKGFGARELRFANEALMAGQDIHAAFDPLHLGERFCRDTLGLTDTELHDANFKLLAHLGFDEDAINGFECAQNGHGSVEGAPFLRTEDYAIFALSEPGAETAISVEAQLQMAAAVQPYISGGASCPIRTPATTTVHEQRRWMMMAWQMGLKQLQLQRTESTAVAEPIQVSEAAPVSRPAPALPEGILEPRLAIQRAQITGLVMPSVLLAPSRKPAPEAETPPAMQTPTAQPLPSRRYGYVQEVHLGGVAVRHHTEEYEDGRLGALTLELPGLDASLSDALQHQASILTIALQHGVPLSAFESLASERSYHPQGTIEGHGDATLAQSLLDYLLQDLLPTYAAKEAQVITAKPEQSSAPAPEAPRDVLTLAELDEDEESEPLKEHTMDGLNMLPEGMTVL